MVFVPSKHKKKMKPWENTLGSVDEGPEPLSYEDIKEQVVEFTNRMKIQQQPFLQPATPIKPERMPYMGRQSVPFKTANLAANTTKAKYVSRNSEWINPISDEIFHKIFKNEGNKEEPVPSTSKQMDQFLQQVNRFKMSSQLATNRCLCHPLANKLNLCHRLARKFSQSLR